MPLLKISEKEADFISAKRYAQSKYLLLALEHLFLFFFLFVFLRYGWAYLLANWLKSFFQSHRVLIAFYILLSCIIYALLVAPLYFYRTYILEHKYSLSREEFKDWLLDQAKNFLIIYLVLLFYSYSLLFFFKYFSLIWWLFTAFSWIIFSFFFTKLLPVIILPLFFDYKRIEDEELMSRIKKLAQDMHIKVLDCFEINFSKKTTKVNAAFLGMGASKRIVLADTLKNNFTRDEIEVILAHEFAHYQKRHLLKLLSLNAVSSIFVLFVIAATHRQMANFLQLPPLPQVASLGLILFYFLLWGILFKPLWNYFSRRMEQEADLVALRFSKNEKAFVSMMRKIERLNLSYSKPPFWVKLFFFDHPPIYERIALAQKIKT